MPPTQKPTSAADDFNDPDLENSEQNENGTQAQDLADEALNSGDVGRLSAESEPGSRQSPADLVPRDVPDLVDTMNDMVQSGRIDMDAYAGEPRMDDEDEGETDEEDDEDE
ncbi:MAG: hypothetical protein P0Y56_05770 [Candidatus Andeanibacterium colombiense]|uniref:Uncharacterized protein n=1 Tax=Candidatus Andeanibacterium colombiense TaxID=3121345 RepID=A0AAJ5X8I7_9SPHN|nr:MAG: hypothetical protein P0Y56_05770 [Sphingomonadaceae bacterium]